MTTIFELRAAEAATLPTPLPGLVLTTDDLTDQHGFRDGQTPTDYLDWCDDHSTPYPDRRMWNDVLRVAVRRVLLPRLEPSLVEVRDVDAIVHTPLRLERVDGRPVTWQGRRCSPGLPDVEVTIPWVKVAELVSRIDRGDVAGEGWTL
ncbi:hypothetical protein ACOACO_17555 [Nocardioides sp. CPCC 205120]|uniref:hypothetical protein n=1 Tax=Nocardioides sp. CPCC 205120 TaxID=3406462 RepID=UPI003B502080